MNKAIILLLTFFLSSGLWADSFQFKAGRLSSSTSEGRERTLLQNGAEVTNENITIRAQEVELFGKDYRFALARNSVEVIDQSKGYFVEAQEVFYDRERKYTKIQGKGVLEDRENELLVMGEFMEVFDEEDLILIQIQVRILKEDLVCRSEMARYDRGNNILILTGMPVVFWKGDEYRANEITINLDTDEITLQGSVRGELQPEGEEEAEILPQEEVIPEQEQGEGILDDK